MKKSCILMSNVPRIRVNNSYKYLHFIPKSNLSLSICTYIGLSHSQVLWTCPCLMSKYRYCILACLRYSGPVPVRQDWLEGHCLLSKYNRWRIKSFVLFQPTAGSFETLSNIYKYIKQKSYIKRFLQRLKIDDLISMLYNEYNWNKLI